MATSVRPFQSLRPAAASQSITPTENTSARRSTRSLRTCSGAMYATLPLSTPVRVSDDEFIAFAMPKSTIFTCPSYVTNTLWGLMSRCTTSSGVPS